MTSDVATPATEAPKSLFHKAGSYAVRALIATLVLQFIYTKFFWLRLSERASEIVGYVPLIVMLSAIPAGFVALCGIPRYGRKKLLWKGLVGFIVPFILFWVSVQVRTALIESVRQQPELLKSSDKAEEKP